MSDTLLAPSTLGVGNKQEHASSVIVNSALPDTQFGMQNTPWCVAFFWLSDMLTEMQHELACREWSDDKYVRIDRAGDFRGALFDAIQAYLEESR